MCTQYTLLSEQKSKNRKTFLYVNTFNRANDQKVTKPHHQHLYYIFFFKKKENHTWKLVQQKMPFKNSLKKVRIFKIQKKNPKRINIKKKVRKKEREREKD